MTIKNFFAAAVATSALLFGTLAATAGSASAVNLAPGNVSKWEVPQGGSGTSMKVMSIGGSINGMIPGETATFQVVGCGGAVVAQVVSTDPQTSSMGVDNSDVGTLPAPAHMYYGAEHLTGKLGPAFSAFVTFSAPGYADSVVQQHWVGMADKCGSKGTSHEGDSRTLRVKWGAKHGTAKVGHRVRVAAPKATAGSHKSYTWTVGGKVIAHGKHLKVKGAWKRHALKVKVVVSKSGYKTKQKTYSFHKVR